jgi:hypothetical protein
MDALIFALNHSMDLKRDGVDPMIPFAVIIKDNDKTIKVFAGDTPDYGDQMFDKTIEEEKPDVVIYATDSFLTTGGIKYDAVLLKAYDKSDSEIYLVGQKFQPLNENQNFEQIGNPGFLGTIENKYVSNTLLKSAKPGKKPWWKI